MATKPQGDATKARQIRLYLTRENEEFLDKICESMPDLNETDVCRILLSTALRAVKDHSFKITFPMRFDVVNDAPEYHQRPPVAAQLNEKKK